MALEEDLRTRLLALPEVKAAKAVISWYELSREKWPVAVLLTAVGPGEGWTHTGVTGLVNPRVQIDVYGDKEAVVTALARTIKADLQRLDRVTIGGTIFQPPSTLNARFFDTQQIGGTDSGAGRKVYRVMQDFSLWAKQA